MALPTLFLDTPSKHAFSLTAWADDTWSALREKTFQTVWPSATRFAESLVLSLMQKISRGQLRVVSPSGAHTFPHRAPGSSGHDLEPKAELRVINDIFWIRLCTMADLGFAEAYMYGDVECDDLVSLFKIFLLNRESLGNMESYLSSLFRIPQRLVASRFLGTIDNAKSNISAHYDISNVMFEGFLSRDMTYSCAIFEDLDGDLKSETSKEHAWTASEMIPETNSLSPLEQLYQAQIRKLEHIINKAKISSGQRVLEIGCGWGSMAILIAQRFPGTTVDGITLSVQQQALAQARIKEAGLEDRIKIHILDYRALPSSWASYFDRIVSVEMVEAVGLEFLSEFWRVVDWTLKKDTGVGVVQVITIPEPRFEAYSRDVDFIRKWIFPGGVLPTLTMLLQTMEKGSSGHLVIDSVSNIGPHYARTLREWRRAFLEKFESVIIPALKAEYGAVMDGPQGSKEIEVFKRKWLYYYCYCEAGFATRYLGDHILTFSRQGNEGFGCDVYS